MTEQTERAAWRLTPEGTYGCLAIAVVCAAWEGDDLGRLAIEVAIYAIALWAFHVYAHAVTGSIAGRTLSNLGHWAKHEWPHLEAALPAVIIALLGLGLGWDPVGTSDIALWATAANLMIWQAALLLQQRPGPLVFVLTLVLDAVLAVALVWLRLYVK